MDFIMEWITQIIIFVLLATIIDLLIPTGSMKKYIKLVVGLILLLILLKPVFYIFQIDIQQELEAAFSAIDTTDSEHSMESLVDFQKKEIETRQDAYILEQMAVQLIEIAKEPLYEEYQLEINNIDFRFSEEAVSQELNFELLDEVIVYMEQAKDGEGAVNAVEDVVIDTEDPLKKEEMEDSEGVEMLLREVWELDSKELIIVEEGGPS
ncbi:stage III sporulation protein AF [Virgibacillus sp. YIM 98842]|uniref:stage III sporulation protein AF n=1 Tax=Virgibacillus sp. YIM 98842 TaxID=2663533 RepID=UPI0013DD0D50|nr:stage III sporulation protein AF [Virgibacillus sp. YIM 98842]